MCFVEMTMPSKKQYNLVQNDDLDMRIPLHPEEAFCHGIHFYAKYIGTLDIPKPESRVEIVAAMRRIRYEFKAKQIKKRKIDLEISADGVRVLTKKKKIMKEADRLLMHHPIHRIFYVSHDSQDMKIFSFISRDSASNIFKCNVFKSLKKVEKKLEQITKISALQKMSENLLKDKTILNDNFCKSEVIHNPYLSNSLEEVELERQAMRIVRTVGQAFEVCHKLSLANNPASDFNDGICSRDFVLNDKQEITEKTPIQDIHSITLPITSGSSTLKNQTDSCDIKDDSISCSIHHEHKIIKAQMEQQQQQVKLLLSQIQFLKNQLTAEAAARLEAQNRNQHLLQQNKDLLEYMQSLVQCIRQLEIKSGTDTASKKLPRTLQQNQEQSNLLSGQSSPLYNSTELSMPYAQFPPPYFVQFTPYQFNPTLSSPPISMSKDFWSGTPETYLQSQKLTNQNEISKKSDNNLNTNATSVLSFHTADKYEKINSASTDASTITISRSTSERVPSCKREEILSQIQRSAWGRHTTS